MMKGHVLFLSYHLPLPSEPGAFRPWMEARLMVEAGYEVTVVTSGVQYMTGKDIRPSRGWCTEETMGNLRILRTWAPSNHRGSVLKRILNYVCYSTLAGLASVVKVGNVQKVLAGTDPIFLMPVVYLVSLIKRAAMVLDERDLFPETAIALGVAKKGLLTDFLFRLQQFFRRKAKGIVAATPGIRNRLIAYGCPEQKVGLLYNADVYFEQDMIHTDSVVDLRAETGKEFLVGYVGGLGRVNDIPTLLRAAERLRKFKEIGIVIVGSGERKRDYLEICGEHDLTNVFVYESVPRKDARLLMRQMDLCVILFFNDPLFWSTLASKTFDYLGVARPIVFSGRGDTVELLAQSRAGISVMPEDDRHLTEAILKLWREDDLREQLGRSGREWFKANVDVESASRILKQVLENHGCNHDGG